MSADGEIRVDVFEGIGTLIFNDPEHGNALDPLNVEAQIAHALRSLDRDRTVRVVVIAGAGPDFCVGAGHADPPVYHDARDMGRSSVERLAHGFSYGTMWEAFAEMHKPLVAAVRGQCRDGGFGIALACDFVIAGRNATFVDTSIERGRSPFWPCAPVLVRAMGKHRVNELLLLGRTLTASDALRLGLVTTVVDDADRDDAADQLARELANRPPVSISLGRHLIRKAIAETADYALTRSWAYHSVSTG